MTQSICDLSSKRNAVWHQILAFIMILVMAQVLIGALSLSALSQLTTNNISERIELEARQSAASIQTGLHLGKTLEQYFGLNQVLKDLESKVSGFVGASVVSSSGGVVDQIGRITAKGTVSVAIPLMDSNGLNAGSLNLNVEAFDITSSHIWLSNIVVLLAITLIATLLLLLVFKYLDTPNRTANNRAQWLLPVVVLLVAQLMYAAYTTNTFRTIWLDVTYDNVQLIAQGVQNDFNKILSYGIPLQEIIGVQQYIDRTISFFPLIESISVQADGGKAQVLVELDQKSITKGVFSRALDAVTIAIVSVVMALEQLKSVEILIKERLFERIKKPSLNAASPRLARPIMFGFLFAWALPLSFIPLYARSLLDLSADTEYIQFLMAAPIIVEMGFGLFATLLAGRLSDSYGWKLPVLTGIFISIFANMSSALTGTIAEFIIARGFVGFGYGLAWMGLQSMVVISSPPSSRGHNMSNLIAGLYAGLISGAAVGAMLMQHLGGALTFKIAAVLNCAPFIVALLIVRGYKTIKPTVVHAKKQSGIIQLLLSRDFGLMLLTVTIPFSIVQVGLLNFSLPLYLDSKGAEPSSAGRMLMLYGLFSIYIGPLMGRFSDKSSYKKYWMVAAGFISAIGFFGFIVFDGKLAAVLAVTCLAVSACLLGGAQTSYMLAMNQVQQYSAVKSISIMRISDKIGQMIGPLLVAALFSFLPMSYGLALTGVIYLIGTIVFLCFAPRGIASHEKHAIP